MEIREGRIERFSTDKGLGTGDERGKLKDCFFLNEATELIENKGSSDKMA